MPELPSLWKRAPVTPIPPCWGIRELKCHIVPEELFQAYITPVQTHRKANTFCRAVPGLSSPCVTGAQHPLHLLQAPAERGGGRCKPVVIPSPHLLHPGCRRAAITGRLSKLSPSQEQSPDTPQQLAKLSGQELDKNPEEEHRCPNVFLSSLSWAGTERCLRSGRAEGGARWLQKPWERSYLAVWYFHD